MQQKPHTNPAAVLPSLQSSGRRVAYLPSLQASPGSLLLPCKAAGGSATPRPRTLNPKPSLSSLTRGSAAALRALEAMASSS